MPSVLRTVHTEGASVEVSCERLLRVLRRAESRFGTTASSESVPVLSAGRHVATGFSSIRQDAS